MAFVISNAGETDIETTNSPEVVSSASSASWTLTLWQGVLALIAGLGGAGAIITYCLAHLIAYINKRFNKTIWWNKFYSIFVIAVQRAEQFFIDKDNLDNHTKFACAFRYAVEAIRRAEGMRELTEQEIADITQAIEIVKADLEVKGELLPIEYSDGPEIVS